MPTLQERLDAIKARRDAAAANLHLIEARPDIAHYGNMLALARQNLTIINAVIAEIEAKLHDQPS